MLLNPKTIPKYVNQLTGPPPVYDPVVVINGTGHVIGYNYTVFMDEFRQKILPTGTPLVQIVGEPWYNDGKTWVWGYNGSAKDALTGAPLGYVANSPSATFEATRGIPTNVTWVNRIDTAHMFAVDPTLHWANPNNFPMPGMGMGMPPVTAPIYPPGYPEAQFPVPLIPHLHGGEVQSTSDGHPEAWFLYNGTHGPAYNSANVTSIPYPNAAVFHYPNMQPPTTLWYHDHALGITRINVMSGLAGFYILRGNLTDPLNPYYDNIEANYLPPANYEMPLVIQDRMFKANGEFWFPNNGLNPTVHPYWLPEFFGDTIMVNGLVWPNLYVEPRQYRFRLLDGSNARFYTLSLTYANKGTTLPFTQIGGDGGYLPAPVTLKELTIAPGERADILIDFSALPAGTKLILKNTAKAPFPGGAPVDPQTTGQVMQFTVTAGAPVTPTPLPATLITMPTLTTNAPARMLTLTEVMGPAGPVEILLDGQKWAAPISETPKVGSTEDWIIINPTADTHPIHLHLVQFEVISRQSFQVNKYMKDWIALNGMPPLLNPTVNVPSITPYLSGKPQAPAANEKGWKDTVQAPTGMVTIIRVRYAPLDSPTTVTPGTNLYPFDPTVGPGYVWHCHILDHEDNEMMRPYLVKT
jgi:FtsP/CotA-like multicopper oxidase with cupredoxin domain